MRVATQRWLEQDWGSGWHPFTDQALWEGEEWPVIVRGEGAYLEDSEGRRYLDANSSIWTNIHGHGHPKLVEAIREQAGELCHSSYLGLGNARANELGARLCEVSGLERCFFSDNGSTAIEAALRMELQWRAMRGEARRRVFLAFENGYHGDTLGAASLSGVGRFFEAVAGMGPEVRTLSGLEELAGVDGGEVAAVVIEPLVQGVNEMRVWPEGMLRDLREWCDGAGVHLILDEVMTGFGRTGELFACQVEGVVPDFLCLAKGLTGGCLPLAATLTTGEIYEAFKGPGRTFYYGHSYTGNALGCAVALASLELCLEEGFLSGVRAKGEVMGEFLGRFEGLRGVRAVRRVGMIAGIELAGDGSGRVGRDVCGQLREVGVLTRPILDTVVWMPPPGASEGDLREMGEKIGSILEGVMKPAGVDAKL
ncbi:MAG: aminotransferase class III-fold pyridoxal phosphate-dependent enzyme [Verrucomicrobiota bacterium]